MTDGMDRFPRCSPMQLEKVTLESERAAISEHRNQRAREGEVEAEYVRQSEVEAEYGRQRVVEAECARQREVDTEYRRVPIRWHRTVTRGNPLLIEPFGSTCGSCGVASRTVYRRVS